ncbi:MAG TPA: hypothetical protein VEZ89_13060 [Rubrivivax sp.]|nr:hypothetical protein [Rubrivivax sp.]
MPTSSGLPLSRALNDPRTVTPRPTLESRIAAAVGPGRLTEERIGPDRVRLRHGGQCIDLHRPRATALDPWNQSVSPLMAAATVCH